MSGAIAQREPEVMPDRAHDQRIRDPVHDLIEFSEKDELERTLWRVLQTKAFQRLRRVKQLGFSDLVYPGASHSQFAHSVGVFHTARQLMKVVHDRGLQSETRERRSLAAALLHDLGHGPFSHAFEKVGQRLGLKLADHESIGDSLIRSGEVASILNDLGSGFANDVADIVKKDGVKYVQHAVVSSQFDADRLDYIRRDRMMTGTQHSAIDFPWLIANLEIGSVPIGVDEKEVGKIETFVLGPKATHAAEGFVLGLFQLYPTVYFHKATRCAEKIFAELLVRVVELIRREDLAATTLPANHPLVRIRRNPEDIETALTLDNSVVWGALTMLANSSDEVVGEFSKRLRDRSLYKCRDVRSQVVGALNPNGQHSEALSDEIDRCCVAIRTKLTEWNLENGGVRPRILWMRRSGRPTSPSTNPRDRLIA